MNVGHNTQYISIKDVISLKHVIAVADYKVDANL